MAEHNVGARTPAAPDKAPLRLIILALAPFAFGYFLSYFFRAVNAVVAPDLVAELDLGAGDLGLLTAAYLAAFALFQLPLGILLDTYGPRRVQFALIGVAAAGAAIFAIASDTLTLTIARALIGLGFAGGLMAGFKATVIWVSPERRALANAYIMSAGAVGLIVATAPAEWAVSQVGWRDVFLALSGVTAVSAVLILALVPERDAAGVQQPAVSSLSTQIGELGAIMTDRVFWAVTPLLGITAGTQIAIQTLWAGPWLSDVAGLDRAGVAEMLSLAAFAFLVGVLVSGNVADILVRRGISLLTTMMGFLAAFLAAQVPLVFGVTAYSPVTWFVFGMCGQVAVLAYPWMSQHFGPTLAGRSNAAINLFVFGAAFAVQYLIGVIIDLYPQTVGGGYPPAAYTVAFGVFFALQIVALGWYLANARHLRAAEAAFDRRV